MGLPACLGQAGGLDSPESLWHCASWPVCNLVCSGPGTGSRWQECPGLSLLSCKVNLRGRWLCWLSPPVSAPAASLLLSQPQDIMKSLGEWSFESLSSPSVSSPLAAHGLWGQSACPSSTLDARRNWHM